MKLPQPRQMAPATTSEDFARMLRNTAFADLDEALHLARLDFPTFAPGAVLLDEWLRALEQVVVDLARADRFAPDHAAPPGGFIAIRSGLVR